MSRTRLLIKYRKNNSAGNLFAYKRQRNFCVKLLRKSKKNFYNNLNVKRITDHRKFWQTIKPNCTDKTLKDERITLVNGDKVITEEKDVVKIFKDHFEKIVETLKIDRPILSDLVIISSSMLMKIFLIMLAFSKSRKQKLLIAFLLN